VFPAFAAEWEIIRICGEDKVMNIAEILAAAREMSSTEFLRLRQRLDRLEEKLWKTELTRATEKFSQGRLTDEKIDQMVLRRRRESRS